MSIILKRIYMENFKLFKRHAIVFEDALTVFDGPNGYGKTSTFEAIELLITGQISRVDNEVVQGSLGYSENYLANDQTRDVVVKGEFLDTQTGERLVIVRRIPVGKTKRDNNPKVIFTRTQTYFLPEYDFPEELWKAATKKETQKKCEQFFGMQSMSLYMLLHYVRQEDRLSFFKNSEKGRTEVIEQLLGLEEHREKLKKTRTVHAKLSKEKVRQEDLLKALQAELQRQPKMAMERVPYEALAGGRPIWDREDLKFRGPQSDALYQDLLKQTEGVKELYRHREEFRLARDTEAFRRSTREGQPMAVLAWKLLRENENAVRELREKQELHAFCSRQDTHIQAQKYESVDWAELCRVLGMADLAAEFSALATRIKNAKANQTDVQKSLTELERAREVIHRHRRKAKNLQDGTCPYCGQVWADEESLETGFEKTKAALRAVLGRDAVNSMLLSEECGEKFRKHCLEKWMQLLQTLEQDVALQVFRWYSGWQFFQSAADAYGPLMDRLQIRPETIRLERTLEETVGGLTGVLKQAGELCASLSAEYMDLDQKHRFGHLYASSFEKPEDLDTLSLEKLERKQQYIHSQYYHSFDETLERIRALEEKKKELGALCKQLKQYSETLNKAINAYRKQVISQIEIPFFFYSSRLLQSYPGGQGILISSEDGDKVRFVVPEREHDVYYTMSSGQLSAVLLSFELSLNRIYAGNGFQTLLIDDPIQCMDDINMVSLVELLGREFGQSQVILSTHEDVFAKYIRYKYGKYGLSHKSVSMKDGSESGSGLVSSSGR